MIGVKVDCGNHHTTQQLIRPAGYLRAASRRGHKKARPLLFVLIFSPQSI